jgi:IclR family acetate operon transcriptional repressor
MSLQSIVSPVTPAARAAKPRRPDGDLVQSLMRALTLLELLSEKSGRLTDLAKRAKLPPSTTHRLLTTLEQKRFVRFDREESLWTVASHCFSIGAGYLRDQDLFTEAAPRLDSLANRLGATVNLGVLEGGNLLLVKQATGAKASPAQPPGTNFPLHATAMGKTLLAGTGDQAKLKFFIGGKLQRLTAHTICDPTALARELSGIREQGIAVDNEESMTGRRCLAAPIYDELGHCVAAISLTATPSQMTDSAITRLSAALAATAGEITKASGGYGYQRHDPL